MTDLVERLNDLEERITEIEERLELAGLGSPRPIDLGISREDLFSLRDDLAEEHTIRQCDNVIDFYRGNHGDT